MTMADAPSMSPHTNAVISPNGGKSTMTLTMPTGAADAPPTHLGFHHVRRAVTVDEGANTRWRPLSGEFTTVKPPFDESRRRSSTFSDYSLGEARRGLQDDILNPGGVDLETHEKKWSWLPLVFALLPPVGGILHKNGSGVITDLMLLGLAAVFLNWSVTQPWTWYHAAQEVRTREEMMVEIALESDSDHEDDLRSEHSHTRNDLDDVPEEETTNQPKPVGVNHGDQARKALAELYLHEVLALLMCFTAPVMGAFLLHAIRNQLSRPSEGLVSNYNLTIFILAAEIAPLSHLIKLVQARTLHLQRIVQTNPYREEMVTPSQVHELARRLEDLEGRTVTAEQAAAVPPTNGHANGHGDQLRQTKMEARVTRDVRNAIQPELDALNRAVRRYEKKATVQAAMTESRLGALDTRLNDAISLAAAAAKMSSQQQQWRVFSWLGGLVDRLLWVAMLPFQALLSLCMLPLTTALGVLGGKRSSRKPTDERSGGGGKRGSSSKSSGPSRVSSSDRMNPRAFRR